MKTFRTVGSGSTQTIEPIENNKIPVYETKTAAETDLANLEVEQIIATKDEGSELSNPVDVVQDGNMHAVTSNAVADALAKTLANAFKLSPLEGFTLSTTNQAAQYDGFLFVYMIGNSNVETEFYVNDEQLFIIQAPAGFDSPITIPLCKGDTIRVNRIDGGIYWTKARWYKNR